jgi:hypothetical protein
VFINPNVRVKNASMSKFALCYKAAFTTTASDSDGIAALYASFLDFHG